MKTDTFEGVRLLAQVS